MGRIRRYDEPLFLEADTRAVLEWQEAKDWACSGCGQDRRESFAKQLPGAYEAHVLKCHACKERELALRAYTSNDHDPAGLFAVVHPVKESEIDA